MRRLTIYPTTTLIAVALFIFGGAGGSHERRGEKPLPEMVRVPGSTIKNGGEIAPTEMTVIDRRQCVIQSYRSQVGVREATGRNDGFDVEKYLRSTGFDKGFAWCAAFINWNLRQCDSKSAGSAWSPDWFNTNTTIYHRGKFNYAQPRGGDVFGIYFPSKSRVAHVGFIDKWGHTTYAQTIEGNTNKAGSREGDGVYKKFRHKKQIYQVSNWIDSF